jgi:zinc-ribbon domain
MFCPDCGKLNSAEQKFCRSCGLSLDKVAQSLAEQRPATELNKHLKDRQRQVERWLSILLGGTFGIFVLAVLWAIVYQIIIVKGDVLKGLIFLTVFVGTVAALILVVYRESLRESLAKRQLPQTPLPMTEHTTRRLPESDLKPIPSVTESTTELLYAEKKSAKPN